MISTQQKTSAFYSMMDVFGQQHTHPNITSGKLDGTINVFIGQTNWLARKGNQRTAKVQASFGAVRPKACYSILNALQNNFASRATSRRR